MWFTAASASSGQRIRYVLQDKDEATKLVRRSRRRRERIGASHRFRQPHYPND
jgi:hypothetical protein